jgi:release factor glutamine methyltransferase
VALRPPAGEVWTTRRLLTWMGRTFEQRGLESPRLLAEMLLAHVLGCPRLRLYMDPERPATPLERQALRALVARALNHEPVQYLVGEAWFFGLPFHVDPRVMIPRACTEIIVQEVLQHRRAMHGVPGRGGAGVLVADVCTGSGCIAIAVLKNLPEARGVATDISEAALEVARRNAGRHGVADRIDFLAGDLLEPLRCHPATQGAGSIDYLISNPPYIPDEEWPSRVDESVRRHEPHGALRGGVDGLDFVRPLIAGGAAMVRPGGLMLVEVAAARAEEALSLAREQPLLRDARILEDQDGLPRVIMAHRA